MPEPLLFSHYLMSVSGEAREAEMACAAKHGIGIEIKDFGWYGSLVDRAERLRLVRWYRARLRDFSGPVTVHGPFGDMSLGSGDPDILAISRKRVVACLDVAEELSVTRVVFHTCFNKMDPQPWYLPEWVKRHTAFWQDVLPGRAVEVVLENLYDPTPELLAEAVDAIGLPSVGVCLDAGHAHVHARQQPARWVEVLGARIRHLHLHDNSLRYDQHLVPGKGGIDWPAFMAAIRAHTSRPSAVLELSGEEQIVAAIAHLEAVAAQTA